MNVTLDRIISLCAVKNISISRLEKELGFGNGSIKKGQNISSERLGLIAQRLDVSTDFLLGYTPFPNREIITELNETFKRENDYRKAEGLVPNEMIPYNFGEISKNFVFLSDEELDIIKKYRSMTNSEKKIVLKIFE